MTAVAELSDTDIERITRYIFINSPIDRGDLAFVFGTELFEAPAAIAAELYLADKVRRIVFTGGFNRHNGQPEAERMAEVALKRGVPPEDMLVENRSTNTFENVLYAHHLLAARGVLDGIERIIVIAKNYHMRRACMTLRRWFSSEKVNLYAHPYAAGRFADLSPDTWATVPEYRRVVLGEVEKIRKYHAQDHLAELWDGIL